MARGGQGAIRLARRLGEHIRDRAMGSPLLLVQGLEAGLAASKRDAVPAAASVVVGASGELVMSYGVNDCEARLATLPLERVWQMLVPLARSGQRCREPTTLRCHLCQ